MKIEDIEKILKERFPPQYSGVIRWTNQDVILAIIETCNEFLKEEAINSVKQLTP